VFNIWERKAVISSLLLSLFLLASMFGVVFASENWVEVIRYNNGGGGFGASPSFTINHIEWRIRWEYAPMFEFGDQNDFDFWIIPEENRNDYFRSNMTIASVNHPIAKNGTLYVSNLTGTFFIETVPCSSEWTIIIEQNTDSIPEFPSWIVLPLVITTTLLILIYKMRLPKRHQNKKKEFILGD